MSNPIHKPNKNFISGTNIRTFLRKHGFDSYQDAHQKSVADPSWFWKQVIDEADIEFFEGYDTLREDTPLPGVYDWFVGGEYNLAYDALDKQVSAGRGDETAIIWENESRSTEHVTYRQLQKEANRVANALQAEGIRRGERVLMYVPNVPRAVSILYGAFKIGAVPVPLFSGYGTDSVVKRIESAEPTAAFVGDGYCYNGSTVSQRNTFDEALDRTDSVETVILVNNLDDGECGDSIYNHWEETVAVASDSFETISLPSMATAMVLYTSGTTGEPKGTVHTHAGFGTKVAKDLYFDFDFKPDDRLFWITDVGWIMGPWSIIGAHILGGTISLYSGAIDTPDRYHLWEFIQRHSVTTLGLSPTAIRVLRDEAVVPAESYNLTSLRLLGSTGEPWDEPNWRWFYEKVGDARLPIINVSGGTEAGGHFLAPTPIQPMTPCTVGGPTLGIDVDIVDEQGNSVRAENEEGYLVLRNSFPSLTRGFWDDDDRYVEAFWSTWDDGIWDHGDWAQMDKDGFWYLHGRADDIINIAGRKIAPAEIEGVLNSHNSIREAAAVGRADEQTTNRVVAFVVPHDTGMGDSDRLKSELFHKVDTELGKPFRPYRIEFVESIPKTHSGKTLRRELSSQ